MINADAAVGDIFATILGFAGVGNEEYGVRAFFMVANALS
jgi:hypothetical protein